VPGSQAYAGPAGVHVQQASVHRLQVRARVELDAVLAAPAAGHLQAAAIDVVCGLVGTAPAAAQVQLPSACAALLCSIASVASRLRCICHA
jgi:hypothetical protein